MRPLEIDAQTNLEHILQELSSSEEDGLELTAVPGEETLLDNPLNVEIIRRFATKLKKEIVIPSGSIEEAPIVDEDDLGFVDGEDITSKVPIAEVDKVMTFPVAPETKAIKVHKNNLLILNKLKNKWVLVGGGLAVFLIFLLGIFILLPSAEISLTLDTQTKETQLTVVADPNARDVSLSGNKIPLRTQTVSQDGQDEASSTGKKTIGVAAKGRVTVTNQDTTTQKNFLAGTILTPESGTSSTMTFKLDTDITVDQAKPGPSGRTTAGVNVTAVGTGPDGNAPSGVIFKVGNAPDYLVFATNDVAFTGGSNQQVTVVSSGDRDELRTKLLDKLSKNAQTDLVNKVKGSMVPDGAIETTVSKESFDPKAVDSQADKVKLSLTVQAKASLINKDDLTEVLVNGLEKTVKNYSVNKDKVTVTAKVVEKLDDGSLNLIGKIKGSLTPEINEKEIKDKIKGKSLGAAKSYLDSLKSINDYKVGIKPGIFSIFNLMPFNSGKIRIIINN